MKKSLLMALFSVLGILNAQNQKLAYVDTELILERMPEFRSTQSQLDDMAVQWQADAQQMQAQLDQLRSDLQAEEVWLTADQKRQKQEAIAKVEEDLLKFRTDKFGPNGALVKKREELVKPLQDKVFDAIQKVAKSEGYSFIFDKASGVQMLYADARFDKTYEVLIELGVPIEEEGNSPRN